MSIAAPPRYTIDEFLALPDHKNFELVDGEPEEINVSNLSSNVGMTVGAYLVIHCKKSKLGQVFGADAYFQCFPNEPGHARKPDASFIRQERLPEDWNEDGYFTIAPDLAVEVISPGDLVSKLEEKIAEYLEAGVKLVWIIDPEQRLAYVHRADGTVTKLKESGTLSGEDVVPGFTCAIVELFPSKSSK